MDNYFEYTIRVFKTCRTNFNHRPYTRREEWNHAFRAAIQNFSGPTQGHSEAQQQGSTWTSAPMDAHQPLMSGDMHAFSQTARPLGYQYSPNELQRHTDRHGVDSMSMASQGQQINYTPTTFLKPQVSLSLSRGRDCSSQTSMRSGASSTSNVDMDTVPTPGTSQDGYLDVANHTTASSTSSSLHLPPQAEASRKRGRPSWEPPETILPDQRRPTAPHNITTPVDLSRPKVAVGPTMFNSVSWDGGVTPSHVPSAFSDTNVGYGELGDQGTGGWPGSYYGLDATHVHYQPDPPENWDPSQYSSSCSEFGNKPDYDGI